MLLELDEFGCRIFGEEENEMADCLLMMRGKNSVVFDDEETTILVKKRETLLLKIGRNGVKNEEGLVGYIFFSW